MSGFTKFFLYALTTGIGKFQDSKGALRRIDDILETPEEALWLELQREIQQAHRLRILRSYNIDMEMGAPIDPSNLPNDIVEDLLTTVVDMDSLKRLITKEIEKRGHS